MYMTYMTSKESSKNPSVENSICIRSFCYSHVITSIKFKRNMMTDEGNSRNEI